MPLYDYECKACGNVWEVITHADDNWGKRCPECNHAGYRIISASGVFTGNQDARWLKSVLDVVDKEDKSPATREFLKHPTRANYKRWMKKTGLRPLEPNEPTKPPPPDTTLLRKKVWENLQKRRRIEI